MNLANRFHKQMKNSTQASKKLVKGLLVLGLTIGTVAPAIATEERDVCEDNYIIFNAALKSKDYPHAYKYWQKLVSGECETLIKEKKTVYTNGAFVIKKLLKEATNKEGLTDSLFWGYEQHLSVVQDDPKIHEKLGADYAKYKKNEPQKAYDHLKAAIDAQGKDVKSPNAVQYMFRSTLYLYKDKKKTKAEVVEEYLRLKEISTAKITAGEKVKTWGKVSDYLDKAAGPFLTCEILTEVYEPKVDADLTNVELLKKTLDLLNRKECEGDFYEKVVEALHKIEPSSTSAFGLAKIKLKAGKKAEAQQYLDEAIKLEEDKEKKLMYVMWGTEKISQGKYIGVWKELAPNDGRPYLKEAAKFAGSEGNKETGESIALRKLVYCLAIDKCEKAIAVDPGLKSKAQKMIDSYQGRLPACEELFQHGIKKGDSYKVPYWGMSTKVRCN